MGVLVLYKGVEATMQGGRGPSVSGLLDGVTFSVPLCAFST